MTTKKLTTYHMLTLWFLLVVVSEYATSEGYHWFNFRVKILCQMSMAQRTGVIMPSVMRVVVIYVYSLDHTQ